MLVGSIAYLVSNTLAPGLLLSAGAIGIWLLAIGNGFWIHGRPTVSHHVIRGILVAVLLFLMVAGLD
ncbi:MAG: hypothetical protein HY775_03665 [Acidobacteria bacterium]|nr:hypothetical protein [Acidobacteriota bacterium]